MIMFQKKPPARHSTALVSRHQHQTAARWWQGNTHRTGKHLQLGCSAHQAGTQRMTAAWQAARAPTHVYQDADRWDAGLDVAHGRQREQQGHAHADCSTRAARGQQGWNVPRGGQDWAAVCVGGGGGQEFAKGWAGELRPTQGGPLLWCRAQHGARQAHAPPLTAGQQLLTDSGVDVLARPDLQQQQALWCGQAAPPGTTTSIRQLANAPHG
jgi:hypothetical protein